MNIASMQTLGNLAGSAPTSGNAVGSGTGGPSFGSVFNSLTANNPGALLAVPNAGAEEAVDESVILGIFDAATIEELLAGLGLDPAQSKEINTLEIGKLAELMGMEPKELIDSIAQLLEKSGLSKSELTAALYTNDFWTLLDSIDKVAPQFFNHLMDGLEGKGMIPKDQAVELLTFLKAVELVAPKMDLHVKQEQQVFSLQSFIAAAGEQFGNLPKNSSTTRLGMAQMLEPQNIVRYLVQPDAKQDAAGEGAKESTKGEGIKESLPQTSATLGNNQTVGVLENNKDSSTQVVSSAAGNLSVAKSEVSATELENRNNARNEALMKEMQDIFKRSNFGQTGGTNRLLIKLYPEHLGQVRIELIQVNGVMTARILASTALGKEMLSSQLHQLKGAFVQQNLQVDRIDVSQTLQDTSRNERDQAFNQHFKREQESTEQQQEQNPENEMTFQEYMIELEA